MIFPEGQFSPEISWNQTKSSFEITEKLPNISFDNPKSLKIRWNSFEISKNRGNRHMKSQMEPWNRGITCTPKVRLNSLSDFFTPFWRFIPGWWFDIFFFWIKATVISPLYRAFYFYLSKKNVPHKICKLSFFSTSPVRTLKFYYTQYTRSERYFSKQFRCI